MNRSISFVFVSAVTIIGLAQNKADIIVSYNCNTPDKQGKAVTTKMSLLASATEAKYFNDLSLWVDSLKSTPDGKAQYMEILKNTCMTVEPDGSTSWDLRKGPTKKTYIYVFTAPAEETLTVYGKYGEDLGYYTEPIAEIEWDINEDSTATVLGYECLMAESDYHGRHWKTWFTPEIPMPFGPWKLRGLPGLILKAEADGGFSFEATGLEHTDRIISPMYLREDYTKVDRKKALENAEYYVNNTESILNAQGQNVKIYTIDDDGNEIEVPKYDGLKHSLEPDYKMK
ncbi:MAG: GLPGLI family protein [Muribaculaceae bacterium]|nr:GLPGLI family protein [Muribaculaceae bacterium]